MIFQARAKATLDTNGHMVLPPAFMNQIGLKEETKVMAGYNGKIIIISFTDDVDLDAALKAHAKDMLDAALKKD